MSRKRFKWTRERYYKAKQLTRLVGRFDPYHIPDQQPGLMARYCELMRPIWEQRCKFEQPLWLRLEASKPDGIPF